MEREGLKGYFAAIGLGGWNEGTANVPCSVGGGALGISIYFLQDYHGAHNAYHKPYNGNQRKHNGHHKAFDGYHRSCDDIHRHNNDNHKELIDEQ